MIKHVKRPSSYDSPRNGWRIERLKGCWLAGVSLLPHWPARTENWLFCQNAKYIMVVFLLSYWVQGGGGVESEREGKEEKSNIHGFFVIVLQRNPLITLPEERTSYLYLALTEGNTFSSFHFTFSNFLFFFFFLHVGHAKRKKDISLDSQMENHSKKTSSLLRTGERGIY